MKRAVKKVSKKHTSFRKKVEKWFDKNTSVIMSVLIIILILGATAMPKEAHAEETTVHVIIEQRYPAGCITVFGNLCITPANKNGAPEQTTVNVGGAISQAMGNMGHGGGHHSDNPYAGHKNPYPAIPNPYLNNHIPQAGE